MSSRSVLSNRAIMPYGSSSGGRGTQDQGEPRSPQPLVGGRSARTGARGTRGRSVRIAGSTTRRDRAEALLAARAHGGDRHVVELAHLQPGQPRRHRLARARRRRRDRQTDTARTRVRRRAVVDAVRRDVGRRASIDIRGRGRPRQIEHSTSHRGTAGEHRSEHEERDEVETYVAGHWLERRPGRGVSVVDPIMDSRGKRTWCRRGDSNPHGLPHTPLKRARLPVPPLRRCEAEVYRYRTRLTNLPILCRRRGSSASRIPSPRRLYERTVTRIANPGYTDSHQPISIASLPSLRMLPQVACGGWTPSPRNDRPDSVRIAAGMPSVIATSTGAIAFGRIWRQTIRKPLAPTACDQMTNSRSLSARNSARTSRATPIHPVRPITAMIVQIEGRRKASTARRRKKRGKTSIRSTRRMVAPSTRPPL